jgi:hypothetical protein
VQQTSDGGYILAGTESFVTGVSSVYLLKTNASGNKTWEKTFHETLYDSGYSVQQTLDGGYIIAGTTDLLDSDVYLIKTDAAGSEEWHKTFGGTRADYGRSVQQTSDGGYIVAGTTFSFDGAGSDVYLIKADAEGNAE